METHKIFTATDKVLQILTPEIAVARTPSSLFSVMTSFDSVAASSLNTQINVPISSLPTLTPITSTPVVPLKDLGEPSVNVQPSRVSLPTSVNFVFICIVSSDEFPQLIQWYFNLEPLPLNAAVSKISPMISQLEITDTQQENAGIYHCTATFSTGKIVTSSANLIFIGKSEITQ